MRSPFICNGMKGASLNIVFYDFGAPRDKIRWIHQKPTALELKACSISIDLRAEPILHRIKEDRTRVISPSFDNIKYDTFEIEEYPLSAQGFDWELWCRYLNPPKSWWTQKNQTAPIRYSSKIQSASAQWFYKDRF